MRHVVYASSSSVHGNNPKVPFGYAPKTPIDGGIPAFVDWFRAYTGR